MKFKLLFCIVFLFFSKCIKAQESNFDVLETKVTLADKGKWWGHFVNLTSGEFLVVRSSRKDQFIMTRFSEDHSIVEDGIMFPKLEDEKIKGNIAFGDKVHLITHFPLDKNTYEVYKLTINLATTQITRNLLYTTTKTEGKRKFSWLHSLLGINKHFDSFSMSPNGAYFAFVSNIVDYKTQAYGVHVFDKNFKHLFTKSFEGDKEKYYYLRDFLITDKAEVIFSGKLYDKGEKEEKRGAANYDYVLHKLTRDLVTKSVIDLGEDYYVNDIGLVQNKGVIKLFGLYSEITSKSMKGTVSYSFNETDIQSMDVKLSPFSKDAFHDIYRSKKAERMAEQKSELWGYTLNYVFSDAIGNTYVTAEQIYYKKNSKGIADTKMYGNIIIVKLDEEGTQIWSRNVLRKDMMSGYRPFLINDAFNLFVVTGKNLSERSNERTMLQSLPFEKRALFNISFEEKGGDYSFENISQRIVSFNIISAKVKWNGRRFLMGGFRKTNGSLLTITFIGK